MSEVLSAVLRAERLHPCLMARVAKRDYGLLYHNCLNPLSHDANHALFLDLDLDVDRALRDICGFYGDMGLQPRIYTGYHPREETDLLPFLEANGFQLAFSGAKFMVLREPSRVNPRPDVEVRRLHSVDRSIWDLVLSDPSEGEWSPRALEELVGSSVFHLLAAYWRDQPVSLGSVASVGGISRVDHVLTGPQFRGKGFAQTLIHRLVEYHRATIGHGLYLWTEHPAARRIYRKAGFRQVSFPYRQWSAHRPSGA